MTKMKRNINWFFVAGLFCTTILFSACEDIVDVTLDTGKSQLSVDAWLDNQAGEKVIRLTRTNGYFENTAAPAALGATVVITDNEGNTFEFLDTDNDGDYTWTPSGTESFGKIGNTYILSLTYEGESYEAVSSMNRVPPIDSVFYEFREEELGDPEGYYAELFARDFEGSGDCYWIKTYRNEAFLRKPNDINIAYDASFSAGGNTDGLVFITPIREGINPYYEDENEEALPPYELGDKIKVELHAIPEEAFYFLQDVRTQVNNGGLFAVPSTNVRTNIVNTNTASETTAVGYFATSAVSVAEQVIEE